jgi:hypothetical protein
MTRRRILKRELRESTSVNVWLVKRWFKDTAQFGQSVGAVRVFDCRGM